MTEYVYSVEYREHEEWEKDSIQGCKEFDSIQELLYKVSQTHQDWFDPEIHEDLPHRIVKRPVDEEEEVME